MSNKNLLKFVVAFGVLAMLLIFLGVNSVPRISALSSAKENAVDVAKYAGSDWIERHPPVVIDADYYAGSDWIERHPPVVIDADYYAGSDWIERHPPVIIDADYYAGSDWIERHPSNYYAGSDWIERHPSNYYSNSDWIERHKGSLTGTVVYPIQARGPGHDFGAIGNASNLDKCLPVAVKPSTYTTSNGIVVTRRSELGPLTGTVVNPLQARGAGHDFGAINGESDLGVSISSTNPCTATTSGN